MPAARADSGLTGAALVQSMAGLDGGRIEIESAPGTGTRVTVYLPAGRALSADTAAG